MADTSDQSYEVNPREPSRNICMLCQCQDPGMHICYWKCPIFDNLPICSECCLIDALRPGIEKKFSEQLGRDITREEITKACQDCGRNHATEDQAIAEQLEANSFESSAPKILPEDETPPEKPV